MSFKQSLLQVPVLGRSLLIAYRANEGFKNYFKKPTSTFVRWLFTSREMSNFTYDLTDSNKRYLSSFVSEVTGVDRKTILGYINEITENKDLPRHITEITEKSSMNFMADSYQLYGRRIGWYAFVRAAKPKVVVETGVDKGLGSLILTSALMKNAEEGFEGFYYGTELDTRLGYLLTEPYSKYGKILYGDSIESLKKFQGKIDLFINDSDHSAEYEAAEYQTVHSILSDNAIVLGDNAHITDKLLDYAEQSGKKFLFFKEVPKDHWYPGAGIGVAFK